MSGRTLLQASMLLVICAAMYLIPTHSVAGKITVAEYSSADTSCSGAMYFDGEIVDGDAASLENEILKLHKKFHTPSWPKLCYSAALRLHLRSPGGSVLEAIAIGQMARKYELGTYAHECASSCVMVFAGGVRRAALGPVEVHQPYFQKMNPELTFKQIGLVRKELIGRISDYLEVMNVSSHLLDVMLSTPPEKMRILTKRELQDLRLEGDDPDFVEREIAQEAYIYGVDSAQLRKGKSRADRLCKIDLPNFLECRTAAILQISLEQARTIEDRTGHCYPERHLPEKEFIECLRSEYTRKSPSEKLTFIPLKPFTFKEASGGK